MREKEREFVSPYYFRRLFSFSSKLSSSSSSSSSLFLLYLRFFDAGQDGTPLDAEKKSRLADVRDDTDDVGEEQHRWIRNSVVGQKNERDAKQEEEVEKKKKKKKNNVGKSKCARRRMSTIGV